MHKLLTIPCSEYLVITMRLRSLLSLSIASTLLPCGQKATKDAFDVMLLSNGCVAMGTTTTCITQASYIPGARDASGITL